MPDQAESLERCKSCGGPIPSSKSSTSRNGSQLPAPYKADQPRLNEHDKGRIGLIQCNLSSLQAVNAKLKPIEDKMAECSDFTGFDGHAWMDWRETIERGIYNHDYIGIFFIDKIKGPQKGPQTEELPGIVQYRWSGSVLVP